MVPPTGPLKATSETVGRKRSPLSDRLISPLMPSELATGSPPRLAAMSCLPAEVTVLAVRT